MWLFYVGSANLSVSHPANLSISDSLKVSAMYAVVGGIGWQLVITYVA